MYQKTYVLLAEQTLANDHISSGPGRKKPDHGLQPG